MVGTVGEYVLIGSIDGIVDGSIVGETVGIKDG